MWNRLGIAVVAIGVASSVQAQDPQATMAALPGQVMAGIANTAAMNDVLRNTYGRSGARTRPGPAPARPATGADAAGLSYRPSPALTRAAVAGFLDRVRSSDPRGAEVLAEQFRQHDPARIFADQVAPVGLRTDNVADALAAYTVLGWSIATGDPEPPPQGIRALRNQYAARLAGDARLADPGAGRIAEELKLMFVTVQAGWQAAQREGTSKAYANAVAAGFRRQGVDLRRMRLSASGFEPID